MNVLKMLFFGIVLIGLLIIYLRIVFKVNGLLLLLGIMFYGFIVLGILILINKLILLFIGILLM